MPEMTLEKLQMVATCNMPGAQKTRILKWWNSSAPSRKARKVPTEACLRESPSRISCQMCLVCGVKGTISSLHMTVVGVGWYSYFDSESWNGTMNLKNYIG